MRIDEIILENEQLDELTAAGVGQGIGKVAGNVVRGTKDFFSGIKQGYQQGRAGTPGSAPAQAAPAAPAASGSAPAQAAPAASAASGSAPAQAAPAASAASGSAPAQAAPGSAPTQAAPAAQITVSQINKAIPTLRTRDLQSVKKNVDAIIAKKGAGASKATPTAQAQPAAQPNLQVQQGGKKKTAALLRPPANPNTSQLAPYNPNLPAMQAVEESKFYSKFLNMNI